MNRPGFFGEVALCLYAVTALLPAGCGAADGETETLESGGEVGAAESALNQPSSWGTWPTNDIPICWTTSSFNATDQQTFRQNVRLWVEQTIGRVTNLRFNGWGECGPLVAGSDHLRLQTNPLSVTDPRGGYSDKTSGNGHIVGWPTQVYLPGGAVGAKVSGQYQGIQRVVLHEIMHALGFGHEFARPENQAASPVHCKTETPAPGNTFDTPYDRDSIMHGGYCGPHETLSPWDVVGLQRQYGIKPYFSIVGQNNKCVDIENPSPLPPTSASRLQAYTCLPDIVQPNFASGNQGWLASPQTGSPGFVFAAVQYMFVPSNSVMDVQWGSTANGTTVWNWTWNGGEAQRWKMTGGEIRGIGDLCLDVPNANFFRGATLQIYTCNGTGAQKWDIHRAPFGGTLIRPTNNTSLCLSRGSAHELVLDLCDYENDRPSQRFSTFGGHITVKDLIGDDYCLDVEWAQAKPGTRVQLIPCRTNDGSDRLNDAQRWYYRGPIRGLGDKCLDMSLANGFVQDGTRVQIYDCHGGANQTFDFHF